MRRLYGLLRWLLVVLIGGTVVTSILVSLLEVCVLGPAQGGEACALEPTLEFVWSNRLYIFSPLFLLIGLLVVLWRTDVYYQARQRFDLLKPTTELIPEDLDFRSGN